MKALLLVAIVLLSSVLAAGQSSRTAERIVNVPFSQLDPTASLPDGSVRYVINGLAGTTPCTAGGSGAFAIKVAGIWQCGKLTPGVGTGDVVGTTASTVGEVVLFSANNGRTIGRSNSLSGVLFVSSGVASALGSTGTGVVVRDNTATLTAPTLLTPTINSFVNAQHPHESAAGGGQLNASNVFSAGTVPPNRVITGTIINARCLRTSNVGQIEVAAADCGSGGGGSPGGVSGNLTYNESGAFGGISNTAYNSATGTLTYSQKADGNDTLVLTRFTNTTPTGTLLRARNADNSADLFSLGVTGTLAITNAITATNIAAPSVPASGKTAIWTDSTTKTLKAQDDVGNVSGTVRAVTCSGTDKLSAISSSGVPTCSADQGGAGTGVITLNGLNSSDQTFAAVDDTNIDINWTSATSTHTLTVAWLGTLAKARQNAATVYTDQANTWSTGAQDFGAAASLKVPTAAGASPTANGLLAYDSTSNSLEYGENGTNRTLVNTAGSQTLGNKTLDNSNTLNVRDTLFTLQDNTDSTKTVNFELGGITTGTNRVVTIANAASVTVQPTTATTNQFVTHIDSAGVVQKAQPSFANLSGSMGVTQGGTGLTATAQGDVFYADATNSIARLAKSTAATRVLCNTGASNNPIWCQADLTTAVTGILPSANGGTNNAFFAVSGPAASTKTFTLPNASATILTDAVAVTIAQGGTGQTTQTAAFNALDPLTTKGDLLTHDGTNSIRLGVGTNGFALIADSAQTAGVKWAAITASAGGATTQLQRNNSGVLGGISGATSDGTNVTFGAGNAIIGNLSTLPTPVLGALAVDTDDGKLYFGINGTDWGEVYVSGLSTVNLASANVTGTLPLANGGTNQTTWTASRCVQVNSGGTALESAAAACGGGGTPGGSDTQVQFNDGGVFGGDAGMTYAKSTDILTLAGGLVISGTGAGAFELAEGTIPTAVANRVTLAAPTDVTAAGWVLSLPTTAGTSGQFLQTNGSGVTTWATPSGSGTVTATGGSLTANSVVLGAGTTDTKVVAGIVTDGTSKLTLGVAGTSVGSVDFKNATSGTITLSPVTGALGTVTLSLPARTATVATTTGTLTSGRCVEIDASGNFIQAAAACGTGGSGANTALSNLASVAINTSLLSDTDLTDDLGSPTFRWHDISAGAMTLSGKTMAAANPDGDTGILLGSVSITKNDTNTRTFNGVLFKPILNAGASNTTTTLNVLAVDTTNTATTGLTTNLLNLAYGGTTKFKVGSDGTTTIGSSGTGVLGLGDTDASNLLNITPGSNLTADRTLTLTTGDANRTLTLTGDLAMSGAFNLTLTTTATTNVTLPTTGTLATLAGSESLTNKKLGSLTTNGFVKTSGSDGTLSVDTSTYETASSTKTLTNTTIDPEATGNNLGFIATPDFPAAGCSNTTAVSFWDLPTSTPAVAACVTGTNTQKAYLDFADTSGGFSAQTGFRLPPDFTGTMDAKITWLTTATSGNVKWSLSTICVATDATETDDPAFNTASTVTTAAPGVASRLQTSSITSVTITGCAAGEWMHVKIFRDGNDAADTIAATARLVSVQLILRRTL